MYVAFCLQLSESLSLLANRITTVLIIISWLDVQFTLLTLGLIHRKITRKFARPLFSAKTGFWKNAKNRPSFGKIPRNHGWMLDFQTSLGRFMLFSCEVLIGWFLGRTKVGELLQKKAETETQCANATIAIITQRPIVRSVNSRLLSAQPSHPPFWSFAEAITQPVCQFHQFVSLCLHLKSHSPSKAELT